MGLDAKLCRLADLWATSPASGHGGPEVKRLRGLLKQADNEFEEVKNFDDNGTEAKDKNPGRFEFKLRPDVSHRRQTKQIIRDSMPQEEHESRRQHMGQPLSQSRHRAFQQHPLSELEPGSQVDDEEYDEEYFQGYAEEFMRGNPTEEIQDKGDVDGGEKWPGGNNWGCHPLDIAEPNAWE